MENSTLGNLLVIIAWTLTTGIPAGLAVWKHLRAKAYKDATDELMKAIEKYDSGPVKDAVHRLVSKKSHDKVITPFLKENGYEKKSSSD